MIGVDSNVLLRYYIDDQADTKTSNQRAQARALIESGVAIYICKTVLLEMDWIMRGYYGIGHEDVIKVFQHILTFPSFTIEDREAAQTAVEHLREGFDFADALHHASCNACTKIITFDSKRFARRAQRKSLLPKVRVPNEAL